MLERFFRWVQDHFIRSRQIHATRLVAGSFAAIILVGTLLLALPGASRTGESQGLFTAFFTATSATCVTGLVVTDTALTWTPFGQGVILVMIQLGGLGFMTVITLVSLAIRRRIGLSERLLMVSTLNLNDLDGVVRVVRHALMGTALFELAGTALLSIRMIPRFGLGRGVWHALFHSVSAFCNAGFDLQGADTGAYSSLSAYGGDPLVLLTTSALIVVGGLGFFVWEDWLENRRWKKLTLYSRLVLGLTGFFLLAGTLFFLGMEWNNPATLGPMTGGEKCLNALFQSVTLRTAGFNVIDQGAMTEHSQILSCILMLIGGSSGSTAGGMKTVTVWVLAMVVVTGLRGRESVVFRGRSLSMRRCMNAVTLFLVVVTLFLTGAMLISLTHDVTFVQGAFETASALGTVGLTTGITPTLARPVQGLLAALMYTGRVGVLSFSIAFLNRKKDSLNIKYPEFPVMIG